MSASRKPGDAALYEPGALHGRVRVGGDKSISHRALMLAALAEGTSRIDSLNRGEDVRATRDALLALGAEMSGDGEAIVVRGGRLRDPAETLDARNSGTTARLLAGLCAGAALDARFDGDASLRGRPMERIARPLRAMGAQVTTTNERLPMHVVGPAQPAAGATLALEVPSAQIKSAFLFAHLRNSHPVRVTGDRGSRDHTERMLRQFGREIAFDAHEVTLLPGSLHATDIRVPGDFSAAVVFLAGASIAAGSELTLEDIGVNPTRTGALAVLRAMGADIVLENERVWGDEPVADLRVRSAPLAGATISGETVVRAIDELVVLAVVAAFARGRTEIREAAELRAKESDRIAGVVRMLRACGIDVEEFADGLAVAGGQPRAPAQPMTTHGDHRLAMAAALLAAACGRIAVDDGACVAISFPEFATLWRAAQRPNGAP